MTVYFLSMSKLFIILFTLLVWAKNMPTVSPCSGVRLPPLQRGHLVAVGGDL